MPYLSADMTAREGAQIERLVALQIEWIGEHDDDHLAGPRICPSTGDAGEHEPTGAPVQTRSPEQLKEAVDR